MFTRLLTATTEEEGKCKKAVTRQRYKLAYETMVAFGKYGWQYGVTGNPKPNPKVDPSVTPRVRALARMTSAAAWEIGKKQRDSIEKRTPTHLKTFEGASMGLARDKMI